MQPIDTAWIILKDMAGMCRACGEKGMRSGICQACGTPSLRVQQQMEDSPDYKRNIREQMGTADDDTMKAVPTPENLGRELV